MHRACTRLRQRNPNLFIVESLFANGEQGAWYDPSDLNSLFQDAAGTIPVTASGDPVGLMRDKSGRGNHVTQATAGLRPIFRDVNGLRYLEFDGVDDILAAAAINFTATDSMSLFAGMRKLSDAAMAVMAEFGNSGIGLFAPLTSATAHYAFRSRGTATATATSANNYAAPNSAVITGQGDISDDTCILRTNGVAVSSATDQGTGTYGNTILNIGRRTDGSLPFTGHLYGLIVRGAATDAAGIANAERYLASKTAVILP